MKRRTLTATSIAALVSAGVLLATPRIHDWGGVLSVLSAGTLLLCLLGRARGFTHLLAGVGFALVTVLQLPPDIDSSAPSSGLRARCEGIVIDDIGNTGRRLLVVGEVDTKETPAFMCTTMVQVWGDIDGQRPNISKGSAIICYGRVSRPVQELLPEVFNETDWLRSLCVSVVFSAQRENVFVCRQPSGIQRLLMSFREYVRRCIEQAFEPRPSSIVCAMILGDKSTVDKADRKVMINLGTAHVLAVSGAHVGLIALIVASFLGSATRSGWRMFLLMIITVGFVVFSGASPPSIRAGAMACAFYIGRKLEYDVDALNILGGTVLVELVVWPSLILSASFLLSTIATAGIIWLYSPWSKLLARATGTSRVFRFLSPSIAVSSAASTSVALPSSILFGGLPLLAPISNVLIVALFMTTMCSGILAVLCSPVSASMAQMAAVPGEICVSLAFGIMGLIDSLQPSVQTSGIVFLALLYAAGLLWLLVSHSARGLLIRAGIMAVIVFIASASTHRNLGGLYCKVDGRGLSGIVIGTNNRGVNFSLTTKNGALFVRSKHAD